MRSSPPPVLILTGMHRSGTSAITAAFASAGLAVGARLMPPARGNPLGHFEDLDFVSLHERILRANGMGTEGFTTASTIPVPPSLAEEADSLIAERRSHHSPWGWKDPRTTLFLDWWVGLLPEARFILLFRNPAEVIDSLFRRGDDVFALNPAFAIDVWIAYNRRLLDFFRLHSDRCLLADAERGMADPRSLIDAARSRWDLPLAAPADVVEPALFRRQLSRGRRSLVARVNPAAAAIHAELLAAAGEPSAAEPTAGPVPDPGLLALAEWCRGAGLQDRVDMAEANVISASGHANRLAGELADALEEVERLRAALAGVTPPCEPATPPLPPPKKPFHSRISREARRLARQAAWLGSPRLSRKASTRADAGDRRWT